jgi:hypothetical protein
MAFLALVLFLAVILFSEQSLLFAAHIDFSFVDSHQRVLQSSAAIRC